MSTLTELKGNVKLSSDAGTTTTIGGKLGIGTSTPQYSLDVSGDLAMNKTLTYFQPRNTDGGYPDGVPFRIIDGSDTRVMFGQWIYTNATATTTVQRAMCFSFTKTGEGMGQCPILIQTRPNSEGRVGIGFLASDFTLPPNGTSLDVNGLIRSTGSMTINSDRRIKTNIVDIDDEQALLDLRKLKPKTYTYKDIQFKNTERVYGFIAQEVKEVLNYASSKSTNYIPNIYEYATIIDDLLTFTTFHTSDLERDVSGIVMRIRLRTNNLKDEEYVNILDVIDDKTIKLDLNSWDNYSGKVNPVNSIFVYGQQVDDFHTLNKDAIWTVTTAALQEVDRQLQAEKQKVLDLQAALAVETQKTAQMETTLTSVLARLEALERTAS